MTLQCPILLLSEQFNLDCKKDDCAWYDSKNKKCSVLNISEKINSIETLASSIKALISETATNTGR